MAVGKEVAPVIRKQGEKLLPESIAILSAIQKWPEKRDGIF
jgi:glutaredoxin 2